MCTSCSTRVIFLDFDTAYTIIEIFRSFFVLDSIFFFVVFLSFVRIIWNLFLLDRFFSYIFFISSAALSSVSSLVLLVTFDKVFFLVTNFRYLYLCFVARYAKLTSFYSHYLCLKDGKYELLWLCACSQCCFLHNCFDTYFHSLKLCFTCPLFILSSVDLAKIVIVTYNKRGLATLNVHCAMYRHLW